MKPRVRIGESVSVQRGFALIALLALAALISAFLIASALNLTRAGNSNEREDRSMKALTQAKAALIAYAASETWQNTGGVTPFQPGALPCPDRDNDGIAEDHEFPQKPCDTALKRIGRLPWKTIGADDLRDASGESLWYAVSASFLKNTPSYTNSDTLGQLKVTGSAPANNVVAIVFAPGEAIQGQVRSPANVNDPASYLEQFNAFTYATFTSTGLPSAINNDRLLVITQADLMATVEPVVAANIERDIKPAIQAYSTVWSSAFPFAVPLGTGPSATQSAYTGQVGQTQGLLPITNSPTLLGWRPGSVSVQQINGGTGNLASVPPIQITWSCSTPSSPPPPTQFTCQIDYSGTSDPSNDRPAIQMQAVLEKAALSFPTALTYNDASMLNQNSNPVTVFDPDFGQWSGSSPAFPVTVDHVPAADGSGLVRFRGRLQNAGSPSGGTGGTVFITVSVPGYMPITNSADPTVGWFITNQWYRQTFFAVSPGFAPGGGGACSLLPAAPPPPSCLMVNNLPSPTNNKRAILVFAGRALNGSARPSGTLSDYLEGQNSTPADFIYEHRAGNPTAINDRVVVVSP